jgi:hypothetical protein
MKVVLAILALSAQALAVDLNKPAEGVWSISERVCSNNVKEHAPNDAFVLGRDSMVIEIKDDQGTLTSTINGQPYNRLFKVDQQNHTIDAGDGQQVIYKFDPKDRDPKAKIDYNTLVIMSGGFGERGSCLPNETLFTLLKRAK